MTISLDSVTLSAGDEKRQRVKRAFGRIAHFLWQMACNPLTAIGGAIVLVLMIVALFAPWIAPFHPLVQDLNNALSPPSAAHWFGTDEFGRDIFSRLVYGSRITLYIVLLVSVIVGPLGLLLGVTSGYFGGRWINCSCASPIFSSLFPAWSWHWRLSRRWVPAWSMWSSPSRSPPGRP